MAYSEGKEAVGCVVEKVAEAIPGVMAEGLTEKGVERAVAGLAVA